VFWSDRSQIGLVMVARAFSIAVLTFICGLASAAHKKTRIASELHGDWMVLNVVCVRRCGENYETPIEAMTAIEDTHT